MKMATNKSYLHVTLKLHVCCYSDSDHFRTYLNSMQQDILDHYVQNAYNPDVLVIDLDLLVLDIIF